MDILQINSLFKEILDISPDAITQIVLVACLFLLAMVVLSLLFPGVLWLSKMRDIAPPLMVSAGIIGTFVGIYIALSHFKGLGTVAEMRKSLPAVLDGMNLAFITSIIGLIFAFGTKILIPIIGLVFAFIAKRLPSSFSRAKQKPLGVEEYTLDLLREIRDGIAGEGDKSLSQRISELQAEYRDGTKDIKQSISGGGESSATDLLREIKDGIAGEGDKSLSQRISELQAEYRDGTKDIKQSISGEGESSVAGQLIKLREESATEIQALGGRVDGGFNALNQHLETVHDSLVKNIEIMSKDFREIVVNQLLRQIEETNNILNTQLIKLREESASEIQTLGERLDSGVKMLDGRLEGLSDAIRGSLAKSIDNMITGLREVIGKQLTEQLQETNRVLRTQLTEMVSRIEKALIEQFGATFREFNDATQAIKKWQEDHRKHVEELTLAFQLTAESIENITIRCESIPATMGQLKIVMGELDERLQAFANMKQLAEESFPTIKNNLDTIGADLQQSAVGFSGLEKIITDTHKRAEELAQSHIEAARKNVDNLKEQINAVTNQVEESANNMIAESRNASNQNQEAIRSIVEEVQTACNKCVENTGQAVEEMATKNSQQIADMTTTMTQKWGENLVGIADEVQRRISNKG